MDRVKRILYLLPMRAAKVQASLRIRAVSPEPSLLAHTSSESRGIFRRKARSLAPLNGWACAVKMCHDGMLEDTNSLDGAHIIMPMTLQKCFDDMTKIRNWINSNKISCWKIKFKMNVHGCYCFILSASVLNQLWIWRLTVSQNRTGKLLVLGKSSLFMCIQFLHQFLVLLVVVWWSNSSFYAKFKVYAA